VFIEAKDDGGGGDNWTTGAISRAKLQPNHHHQHPVLLQARCPSCRPTNSVKALKEIYLKPAIILSCSVLPPEIVMHDAYISGRSENNIKCIMHDDLGRKNPTTRYNCKFSAASLALRMIFSVSSLWNIFGSFMEPFIYTYAGVCLSVMGKAEGSAENWHGHVTALTVAPEYRRLGLAAKLMHCLEDVSEKYVRRTRSSETDMGLHPTLHTLP